MSKEKKNRTFESESLILPPLKMVLTNSENEPGNQPAKKPRKKVGKDFNEETVLRIIEKLIAKE